MKKVSKVLSFAIIAALAIACIGFATYIKLDRDANSAEPAHAATYDFFVTGSGTSFTARQTQSGAAIANGNGVTVQNAINAIRAFMPAGSHNANITFVAGTTGNATLDIGSASINLDNTSSAWRGTIWLRGSITSSNNVATEGTIRMTNAAAVNVYGTIMNTGAAGRAIRNDSTGALYIYGGAAVTATTGVAIFNASTGAVYIDGSNITISSQNVTENSGTIVMQDTEVQEQVSVFLLPVEQLHSLQLFKTQLLIHMQPQTPSFSIAQDTYKSVARALQFAAK